MRYRLTIVVETSDVDAQSAFDLGTSVAEMVADNTDSTVDAVFFEWSNMAPIQAAD